jgi:hypothetical protein
MAGSDSVSPFGHHAGAQGHDESLEHGPDSFNVLALYLRNVSNAQWHRFLSTLIALSPIGPFSPAFCF